MNGTIQFENEIQLAKFLIEFTGSTAIFEVRPYGEGGFLLTFKGGF